MELLQWLIKFFDKKSFIGAIESKLMSNQQLAEELHKPMIRKFEKGKLYSSFKDNIWGADLPNMQLISKYNKIFRFLLCVIDIYCKGGRIVHLKIEEGTAITNAFHKMLDDYNRKTNKI